MHLIILTVWHNCFNSKYDFVCLSFLYIHFKCSNALAYFHRWCGHLKLNKISAQNDNQIEFQHRRLKIAPMSGLLDTRLLSKLAKSQLYNLNVKVIPCSAFAVLYLQNNCIGNVKWPLIVSAYVVFPLDGYDIEGAFSW